jgi:pectin methylesterase-like acyl-CoA thioesterase
MGKLTFAAVLAACAAVEIASAEAAVVVVSTTIQAAVNKAKPGDIILVPPGRYRETVRVLKDNITILGPEGAIICATSGALGPRRGHPVAEETDGPEDQASRSSQRECGVTGAASNG